MKPRASSRSSTFTTVVLSKAMSPDSRTWSMPGTSRMMLIAANCTEVMPSAPASSWNRPCEIWLSLRIRWAGRVWNVSSDKQVSWDDAAFNARHTARAASRDYQERERSHEARTLVANTPIHQFFFLRYVPCLRAVLVVLHVLSRITRSIEQS